MYLSIFTPFIPYPSSQTDIKYICPFRELFKTYFTMYILSFIAWIFLTHPNSPEYHHRKNLTGISLLDLKKTQTSIICCIYIHYYCMEDIQGSFVIYISKPDNKKTGCCECFSVDSFPATWKDPLLRNVSST